MSGFVVAAPGWRVWQFDGMVVSTQQIIGWVAVEDKYGDPIVRPMTPWIDHGEVWTADCREGGVLAPGDDAPTAEARIRAAEAVDKAEALVAAYGAKS